MDKSYICYGYKLEGIVIEEENSNSDLEKIIKSMEKKTEMK